MNETGNLIMLTRTDGWPAAIRRRCWPYRLTWAIDVGDLISEAAFRPGSLAVVEISYIGIADQCRTFAELNNNPYDLRQVAVGNHRICGWESTLRAVGFSDVFWSTSQIERMGILATRHFQNPHHDHRTLEETVRAELPWKPVNTTSTNME